MAGMTLQEAADRLGVHYMTAYRYVRLGRLPATKAGNAWVVDEGDLDDFVTGVAEGRSREDWTAEFERLLVLGDPTAAWSLIEQALGSSFTPDQVLVEMVLPAMRSIGDRWALGEVDIAQEHLATAVARTCVARLSPRFNRRGHSRGTVVVALGPGEVHQIGAEVLADLLRGRNFSVLYLGANTPPDAIALAVLRADRPVAVCVAAFASADSLRRVSEAMAARAPDVTLVFGGPVVQSAETVRALGGDVFGPSIPEIVDLVDQLAG